MRVRDPASTYACEKVMFLAASCLAMAFNTYGYDVLDNLTSVTQGHQVRLFTYDSLSRLRFTTNRRTLFERLKKTIKKGPQKDAIRI